MAPENIPDQMTAVVLDSYTGIKGLRVEQRTVPKPGPNQVLVKVSASPINPSDLAFLEGLYGFKKPTPVVPGFEGSGVVVATGSGMMARYLQGRRVACISQDKGDGVWADYMVTSTSLALPLDESVNLEQGAASVVNPLTALAFLKLAKKGKHQTIIQTAAASVLGQMINRLCQKSGIQIINIVRRDEQMELLKKLGAQIILNSTHKDFENELTDACRQHRPHLAFDAVSGPLTMQVLEAMPRHSKVVVYGGLSFEPVQVNPGNLIFQDKSVEGFWLTSWLGKMNLIQSLRFWQGAQKLIGSDLRSSIRMRFPLSDVHEAIKTYQSQMTGGKILLRPEI